MRIGRGAVADERVLCSPVRQRWMAALVDGPRKTWFVLAQTASVLGDAGTAVVSLRGPLDRRG